MPKQCLLRCSPWICCQPALAAPCQVWFPLQSALLTLQGQLLPTLGPVIYWAPRCCLWLPSGCLSGLRFTQSTASLWIIIWPRPACVAHIHRLFVTNWIRPDAGINSGMNSFPQRAMWLAERSAENVMLVCTTHFTPTQSCNGSFLAVFPRERVQLTEVSADVLCLASWLVVDPCGFLFKTNHKEIRFTMSVCKTLTLPGELDWMGSF